MTAHQSVAVVSEQMLQELKRHNYVTPTNYLETVRGYRYSTAAPCSERCCFIHDAVVARSAQGSYDDT